MIANRILSIFVFSIACLLLTACSGSGGGDANLNTQVAAVIAQTQTAVSAAPIAPPSATQPPVLATPTEVVDTAADQFGSIAGVAYLQGPPTPPLTIYAVDTTTGNWVYIETQQSPAQTPFELTVKPGAYQLFAFPAGIAYSLDGYSLSTVTVAAGQIISGIEVRPPSQSQCGPTFGVPASPDGRFAAIPGASLECLVGLQAYKPLDAQACTALSNALSPDMGIVGVVTSPVQFEDFVNAKSGLGCQIKFSADGRTVDNIGALDNSARPVLENLGWQEDQRYGAGGAGGYATAFRKGSTLCLMFVSAEPYNPNLCSKNEPIAVCWEQLAPEQKLFAYTLNCAELVSP